MNIPEFSVKHSILGNMLTVGVVLAGLFTAIFVMQREVFPVTDLDLVVIRTSYPNASPEEVEDLVTNPIEEDLREIEDIDEMTSNSVEGMSVVVVKIDPDSRYKDRVINDIQRKVDQVDDLPEEAEKPVVASFTTKDAFIRVCVSGPVEESVLREYGDYLEGILKGIPGVSKVENEGWRDEEFWVEVDPRILNDYEISLPEIIQSLAQRNINFPGGKIKNNGREILLRTMGKFYNEEEIGSVVVRSDPEGNHVTIRDLGTVRRVFEEDQVFTSINGHRALILGVNKKETGDTIDLADAVKAVVKAESKRLTSGIELTLVDDVSFYVKRRLRVLLSNGLIGMVLVTGCLFIFMNFRVAFFTAFGIPFSFLATLLVMSIFGITINLMSMFGLIIVLGMVVDDAIIVGENIFRHMEEGLEPPRAAIIGTSEVMFPVVSTVLTTVCAFFPLMFAPDLYAKYLGWLVIVVIIALGASLFEVLFVMPSHIADFVKPLEPRPGTDKSIKKVVWMERLAKVYDRVLRRIMHVRYKFLLCILAVGIGSGLLAGRFVQVDPFPADLIDVFFIRVAMPTGTTLEKTENVARMLEERVNRLPEDELSDIVASIGQHKSFEMGGSTRGSHLAQLTIYLTPQNTRDRKTEAIIDEVRSWSSDITGTERLEFEMVKPGPPTGKPFEVKIRGHDFNILKKIAEEIMSFLEQQKGVFDISDNFEEGKEELHVEINKQEAARLGLSVRDISRSVYAAFEGTTATIVREGKDEIKVRVRLQEAFRKTPATLEQLQIPNRNNRLISLGQVASFTSIPGLPAVNHHDAERVITVGAYIKREENSPVKIYKKLSRSFNDLPDRYPGYQLIPSGEWKETKKIMDFMVKALLAAVLMIYTILVVQFKSYLQPLVLLVTIPLGFIGVILALILHDKPVSIMAMMGMVGLGGVVVNDAIVLVTFINNLRAKGVPVTDAIIQAGHTRLRPILLTSITTVVGLLPVIYGWGGYEPFIAPAAIALAYGLVFASFLTLLVVPCVFHVGFDLKTGCRRFLHAVFNRG